MAVSPGMVTVWLVVKVVSSVVEITTPVVTFFTSALVVDGKLEVQLIVTLVRVVELIAKLVIKSGSSVAQGLLACSGK